MSDFSENSAVHSLLLASLYFFSPHSIAWVGVINQSPRPAGDVNHFNLFRFDPVLKQGNQNEMNIESFKFKFKLGNQAIASYGITLM